MALLDAVLLVFLNNISTFILFGFVFLFGYLVTLTRTKHSNLPPGPRRYPIIGNLLLLRGRDQLEVLRECREKYGDIFSLQVFNKLFIVCNGYDSLKQLFAKEGDRSSGRFQSPIAQFAFKAGDRDRGGVLLSEGEVWKQTRRFCLHNLRNFGMGKNILQSKIQEESQHLMGAISEFKGEPFDLKFLLNTASSNIICSIIIGQRFDYRNEEFEGYLRRFDENLSNGGNNLLFQTPALRFIPGDPFNVKRTVSNLQYNRAFFEKQIREHKEGFRPGVIEDLADAYLDDWHNAKEAGKDGGYGDVQLITVIGDLFVAGTETTASTMRWFLLHMLNYPDVQKKIQAEIDEHIPGNRLPNMEDKTKLVNLEAAILETLRVATLLPLSLPHRAGVQFEFKGYTIPTDAFLIPNLDSVMFDDDLFPDPREFRPSRFIDKHNNIIRMDEHIPFSIGRRICLGEALARMELFLFLSAFLQRFTICTPEGCPPPPIVGTLGATNTPNAFLARVINRH